MEGHEVVKKASTVVGYFLAGGVCIIMCALVLAGVFGAVKALVQAVLR